AHRTYNIAERGFQCHINSSKTRTDSTFAFPFFPLDINVRALLGVYSLSHQLDKEMLRDMERSVFSGRSGTMDVYIGAYMFEIFLYGLYTSLFCFWAYILSLQRRPMIWPFVIAAVLMFAIATADVAVTLYYLFRFILNERAADPRPKALLFITNNILAELVLLYRCYLACGYFFAHSRAAMYSNYIWMTFALTVCLTLAIVSKNICSARRARSILGSDVLHRYPAISATFMDSGVLYALYLLIDLLAKSLVLDAGLNQIVGIVPTLIIIRITLRVSLREDTIDTSSTPVLDSIFSTVGTEVQIAPPMPRVEVGNQIPTQSGERAEHA
ncbi:hypothetical protein CVT26_010159, partial [Gymnopilus dilepis]